MPLTKEQIQAIDAMPYEEAAKLLALIRDFKARFLASANPLPASALDEMVKIVPDKLMAEIVQDQRHGRATPSSLAGPVEPRGAPLKGSGWDKPRPLEPPSGVQLCDQIADHFAQLDREQMIADAIDRVRKVKDGGMR